MFRGQSPGFFKRCFLKTNFCTKYSYQKRQNSIDRFLFYSHKISYSGRTINTDLNRVGESANLLPNLYFIDRFVRFSTQNLTISRTDDKR